MQITVCLSTAKIDSESITDALNRAELPEVIDWAARVMYTRDSKIYIG